VYTNIADILCLLQRALEHVEFERHGLFYCIALSEGGSSHRTARSLGISYATVLRVSSTWVVTSGMTYMLKHTRTVPLYTPWCQPYYLEEYELPCCSHVYTNDIVHIQKECNRKLIIADNMRMSTTTTNRFNKKTNCLQF